MTGRFDRVSPALAGAISNRVARIRRGEDPQCLGRMSSGWAILAKFQPEPIAGGCMLLPDPVVPSLQDLGPEERASFLGDMARLADAVLTATGAEHVNHLILCNQVPELHAHVIPRFASEDPSRRLEDPFVAYDFSGAPVADATGLHAALFARLQDALQP